MKAISLWQPWASLMAWDEKRIETRSWDTKYRGPLVICASLYYPDELAYLWCEEPFLIAFARHKVPQNNIHSVPLGAALAVVDLFDCVPTNIVQDMNFRKQITPARFEFEFGDYTAGRFAWLTRNVRPLKIPMRVRGRQGLFKVDGVCRVCACTNQAACPDGCRWIEPDLCSACVPSLDAA